MAAQVDQQGHDELHNVLMTRLQQAAEAAGWKGISITGTPSSPSVRGDIIMSLDASDDDEAGDVDDQYNSQAPSTLSSHIVDAAVKARVAYAGDILVATDVEWVMSTDVSSICLSYNAKAGGAWIKAQNTGDNYWKGMAIVMAFLALVYPAVLYGLYGHL